MSDILRCDTVFTRELIVGVSVNLDCTRHVLDALLLHLTCLEDRLFTLDNGVTGHSSLDSTSPSLRVQISKPATYTAVRAGPAMDRLTLTVTNTSH